MAKQKPITPNFMDRIPTSAVGAESRGEDELKWLRQLLASERKRHAQVERVLTHHIATLEAQVKDLRQLYMSTITVPAGTKEGK